jgi:hypothetical protein
MQDEIKVQEGYQPAHQFISFVEGSASEVPDASSYPLQVLGADHNLNFIDGGDPTEGFSPWVTDILVYPSSEYWETLLEEGKVRPYVDLSISQYNTLRIPSAVHNYNLYVDDARIYGNLVVDGAISMGGDVSVTGTIAPTQITVGSEFEVSSTGTIKSSRIECDDITGVFKGENNGTARVEVRVVSFVVDPSQTGTMFLCNPELGSMAIELPATAPTGTIFTFMNTGAGTFVTLSGIVRARGKTLTERYSAATVVYGDNAWHAFGDLV